MEKDPKKLIFPWIFLLLLPLVYVDVLWGNDIHLEQQLNFVRPIPGTRKLLINGSYEEQRDTLSSLLSRLVRDEDQKKFELTGFACSAEVLSIHCVTNRPVRVDTVLMTVTIPSNQTLQETVIRPYARQEDNVLLKSVTPVKILQGDANTDKTTPSTCSYHHDVPAVVFSSSGFVGNIFHEINEIVIPLYITTRMLKSEVVLVAEDYNPSFMKKYRNILSRLTSYDVINPAVNRSIHCFPGAVIGLKFHGHLSLNSSDIPVGLSMTDFRQFLRESMNLRYSHVLEIKQPTVMFLSRRTTRRFLNEDEMVRMMEELGFRVIVVARAKVISNLNLFASLINSCSVFVAAHGAGLTNELFLPDGAVMVQVDLIGLDWAAANYYGNPAHDMGVHYLRYKIEPEESSLFKVYGKRDHIVFTDPRRALPVQAGKEVYLNGQNVRVNISRFRETMVEAMSLVHNLPLQ